MIVKNEMVNLERCLASIAPYIDCYVIGDTGSTDGTQDFIRTFFAALDIPGEVHEFAFVDFSQARNEALTRARASMLRFDYLLLCDADMELVVQAPDFANMITGDLVQLRQKATNLSYWNVRLVRRGCGAHYHGVTHEFISGDSVTLQKLESPHYIDHATGSNRADKYERDALLLRRALESESDEAMRARYTFYLANTLRDAGDLAAAIPVYQARASMGHWPEEIFMSLYNSGRAKMALGKPDDEVLADFDAATAARPTRAEALHEAARLCRLRGWHERAYDYAKRGLAVVYPRDGLFVVDWIYAYGLLDELSVACYWTNRYAESLDICQRLLNGTDMDPSMRRRIEQNAAHARSQLNMPDPKVVPTSDNEIERTIEALRIQIKEVPEPSAWCRLGELLKQSSQFVEASEAFSSCIASSQDAELTWHAHVERARCDLALGQDASFLSGMIGAYQLLPERIEPLHDLARYYRERGLNHAGLIFAEEGLRKPQSSPASRFVEPDIHSWGLKSEYSILANYAIDPIRKAKGFEICDQLALDRNIADSPRNLARMNEVYYVQPLAAQLPSVKFIALDFDAPQGYVPMNPSIAIYHEKIMLLMRCVNYRIENGRYIMSDLDQVVRTRNYLLELDDTLQIQAGREVLMPVDMPKPVFNSILGFEDLRLIPSDDGLWASATVRELCRNGWAEIVLSRIDMPDGGDFHLADWRVLHMGGEPRHEKNWMPILDGGAARFLYSSDPAVVIDAKARTLTISTPAIAADHFRGGSQAIQFNDGLLMVIHEVVITFGTRKYLHRFVFSDLNGVVQAISQPFYFQHLGIEFAAGMAWHPDGKHIIISFGQNDSAAWLALTESSDIVRALKSVPPAVAVNTPSNSDKLIAALAGKAIAEFANRETGHALGSRLSVDYASQALQTVGLKPHQDRVKNWDMLLALHHAVTKTDPSLPILDAGSDLPSAFLENLREAGFTDVTGVHPSCERPEMRRGVFYGRDDTTQTDFPPSHFGFVASLSFIEHGVDVDAFFTEMARILRPGGHLFVSFDYWHDAIDTGDRMANGAPVHIFSRDEVLALIAHAERVGFELLGAPDYKSENTVVKWFGLDYTFFSLLFRRGAA
jgi:tetratricopeptide (TPR) repeat protein/SAM-dependent methyltransferase